MKRKWHVLFSRVFRILFIGRCSCCAFAFAGLLALHGTGVADNDLGGNPQAELNAVELLMAADDAFKQDNSPANRMALIKVLLTFDEKSLKIQAADHARQLIRELPADPEAYTLYCKSALLIKDHDMLQEGIGKLQKITSSQDFDRRWAEILKIDQHSPGAYPQSGITGKVTVTSNFLRYAAYGFAAWASLLAVLMLAGQAVAKGGPKSNPTRQHLQKSAGPDMKSARRNWHKTLLKLRRFSVYCSIPFILVLAAAIVMGLWHIFKFTGSVPLKQVVVFGMMVLASLVISACCLKEINK